MNAKEYLNRIRAMDFQIRQKKKQIEDARLLQGNVRAFDYSGVKVQTSPHGDANIDLAVKIITLEQELNDKMYALQEARRKIIDEIAELDDGLYVEILTLRYCDFLRLEAIALEMNLSYDRVRHLHGKALQAFSEKIIKNKS